MALPKINNPTFTITMPVTKKKVEFRPFLVKEEKILLVALESEESEDMINAVKNILKNCVITEDYDIETAPFFEIEYLFLNLRAKSVGEVIDLKLKHPDDTNQAGNTCDHIQDVQVNIDDIQLQIPENHDDKIMITDDIGVVLKYPSLSFVDYLTNFNPENTNDVFNIICQSINKVFDDEQVYETKDQTEEEVQEFVESLSHTQFEKIAEFFNTMPKLSHKIEYTCNGCGEKQTYEVEGLENFF